MADEWKYATFSFDFLTMDRSDILNAIDSFLTQTGWEVVPWNATQSWWTPADLGPWGAKFYRRTDHATSDVWHYEGDGPTQRSLLTVFDYDNGSDSWWGVRVGLENQTENDAQLCADWSHALRFDDPSEDSEMLFIGGEYGIYIEGGTVANPVLHAHGFIGTFLPDTRLNGTREDARKWSSQGIQCFLMGQIPFVNNRNYRRVLNDGLNSNKSGRLEAHITRGTEELSTNTQRDNVSHHLGCWDNIYGQIATSGGSTTYGPIGRYSWGLMSTPLDERYRVSPMTLDQQHDPVSDDFDYDAVSSSSTSNTVAPYTGGSRWRDPRWSRIVPKFSVMGHLLIPWTIITDSEGTDWRVARVDDDGRNVNIGIEWPGAANEITL